MKSKLLAIIILMGCGHGTAFAEKKEILIIRGASPHGKAPSHGSEMQNQANWREQAVYWSFTRENGGRSAAMTSAHFYHTWANPHFFQSVANSVFWTLNLEVPKDGVEIATPAPDELLSYPDTAIYKMARHFK